jgi:poly(3-hydroxybutyrate) depolymerase
MKSSLLGLSGALALVVTAACSGSSSNVGAAPNAGTTAGDGSTTTDPTRGDAAAPETDTGAPTTPAPTKGCGTSVTKGMQQRTTTVLGVSRHYQLLVPAAYDAKLPTRLVFVFHGLGGDGNQIRAYFGFESEANGQALFVYPDGVAQSQAGGATGWAESDLSFFDAMVAEISASYCVDAKRVFAAGHSFGGYMSNLVGCERGDVVRAIAPVSGGLVAGGACKGPVAAWVAHGDKDGTVAQSEGIAARDHWLTANGCSTTSKPTAPSPCVAYDGCGADHPVTWCSFSGGHYPLPAFTQKAIWDFFAAL